MPVNICHWPTIFKQDNVFQTRVNVGQLSSSKTMSSNQSQCLPSNPQSCVNVQSQSFVKPVNVCQASKPTRSMSANIVSHLQTRECKPAYPRLSFQSRVNVLNVILNQESMYTNLSSSVDIQRVKCLSSSQSMSTKQATQTQCLPM